MSQGKLFTLLLILLASALISGFSPLYYLLFSLTGAAAVGYLWAWVQTLGLHIDVESLTAHPKVGEPLKLRISVHEKLGLPRANLTIRLLTQSGLQDDIGLAIPARGSVNHIAEVVGHTRGWNEIGIVTVIAADPLGLVKVTKRSGEWTRLLVYPGTVDVTHALMAGYGRSGGTIGDEILSTVGQVASQVREYVGGDSINRIHWPSTARLGRLMTKSFDSEGSRPFVLFLNLQSVLQVGAGADSTEEYLITLAASITKSLSEQGQAIGLMMNGDKNYRLPPDRGRQHLLELLRSMALAKARGKVPLRDFMIQEGQDFPQATVAIIISPWEGEDISYMYRYAVERNWNSFPVLLDSISFRRIEDSQWIKDRRKELHGQATFVYRWDDLSGILSALVARLNS